MSTFELNKIVGAILLAALVSMVIGIVGDGLVQPRKPQGPAIAMGGGAPAPAGPAPAAPAPLEPIAPLLANASPEKGKAAAAKCQACHTFDKGGKNGVGPNLWGMIGADKAHHEGFNYSNTLKNLPGEWTYEDINHFIFKPQAFAKGTKMAFPGVPKAEERADIIAFLRTLSDNPPPLP